MSGQQEFSQYHLIGIGGIGMSCIAQLLVRKGKQVSGSDVKESRITGYLRGQGCQVSIGHQAALAEGKEVVVYSSAIREDNPELAYARKHAKRVLKRAQALAELMEDRTVVAVAGSHGKTTTTSLASYLLWEAGLKPTAAIGGIAKNFDTNACAGEGEYFVAEADESDGTFLYYHPTYAIVTNIDKEHMDYYRDFAHEVQTFGEFLGNTRQGGCVWYCADDPALCGLIAQYPGRSVSFGLRQDAQIHPANISLGALSSSFDCVVNGASIGRFELNLGGTHNISNSLSVIGLGLELGIPVQVIARVLRQYQGAGRRIEVKYASDSLMVIDDYAHHPTEIRATLAAVRQLKRSRVVAVFQPHRYTRTKLLMKEFSGCFTDADKLFITDIYPASEPPIPGVTGMGLVERIKEASPAKDAEFLPRQEIIPRLLREIKADDVVVTLGAGDIVKVCDEFVEKVSRGS